MNKLDLLKLFAGSENFRSLINELNKKEAYDFMKNILLPLEIKQRMLNLDNETERLDFINNFIDLAAASLDSKDKNENMTELN